MVISPKHEDVSVNNQMIASVTRAYEDPLVIRSKNGGVHANDQKKKTRTSDLEDWLVNRTKNEGVHVTKQMTADFGFPLCQTMESGWW